MTHAQKITNSLKALIHECYINPRRVFEILLKYTYREESSFDTQYYFYSHYLSFSYSNGKMISMVMYTGRYDPMCSLINIDSTGEVLIGQAGGCYLNSYKGCTPTAQDLNLIGIDLETYQYLIDIRNLIKPMIEKIASRFFI